MSQRLGALTAAMIDKALPISVTVCPPMKSAKTRRALLEIGSLIRQDMTIFGSSAVSIKKTRRGCVTIRTGLPSLRWREFEPLRSQLNAQHRAALRDLFEPL